MAEFSEPGLAPAPGAGGPSSGGSIAARMDRLPITRSHRRATIAVGLGMFFDIYEVFLAGVLSGVLTTEFHLTKAALAPVLASTFIGMFLGALVLGRAADRYGRRGAFLLNLALYSVFSLLGAFSPNAVWLMVTRFFAGLGLGAELPLADAYLSDLLPARRRGRYIAWAYTISFVGVPFVGFLAHSLFEMTVFGLAGWRWIFIIGALGSVVVFFLRRGLPESPRWLETVGRTEQAEQITARFEAEARAEGHELAEPETPAGSDTHTPGVEPIRNLFRPPYGKRTGMMLVFHLLQTFGYYGFGTLAVLVLAERGYTVQHSLLYTALSFLGYPLGSLLSIPLISRIERKYLVVGSVLTMAAVGLVFGTAEAAATVVLAGVAFTTVSNVFSNSYHVYQAEIFPTELRASATGWTYSLSRLTTGLMPFLLLPLLHDAGPGAVFTVVAGAMLVVAADVALLGPRTSGRSVEALNPR